MTSRAFLSPIALVFSFVILLAAQQSAPAPATASPTAAPQAAQKRPMIPDTYTNLQVLPKDIKKDDLLAIMKGFCIERKIRCSQCHVATDDLSEADFPSDEKPTKAAARVFLKTLFDTRAKYPRDAQLVPATK